IVSMPKPSRIGRLLALARWCGVVVEAASLAALTALIWSRIAVRPPVDLFPGALLYVVLARASALGMVLWAFLAVSVDDFPDVLRASLFASAPAMWLPPAVLLLATTTGWAMTAGMFLIANPVRLLVGCRAPQQKSVGKRRTSSGSPPPMFAEAAGTSGSWR